MEAVQIAGASILSYSFSATLVTIFLFTLMSKFLLELMSESLRRLWLVFEKIRAREEESVAERKIVEEMAPFAEMYYELEGEDVMESARKFFDSMDVDKDGQVSLPDYLSYMDKGPFGPFGHDKWFSALGRGRNRLDPSEVRVLHYMLQSGRPFCMGTGCNNFVGGVYFTCVKCFDGSSSSFSVCLQCYESNRFHHEHTIFLDNFALLEAKRTKSKIPALKSTAANHEDIGSQGTEIRPELHRIAMAYYRSTLGDQEVQSKIKKFVKSVPFGRDRRLALHDFLEFMDKKCKDKQKFKYMNTPSFFKILDKDKKGLDMVDVRTLYYVVESGRPFCRGCREFLAGTFFTCVDCFKRSGHSSFCLCPPCLKDNKFSHKHQLFRDNYAMLRASKIYNRSKRSSRSSRSSRSKRSKRSKKEGTAAPLVTPSKALTAFIFVKR